MIKIKVKVKAEAKAEVKAEVKAEAKAEVEAEAKAEVKAEVKAKVKAKIEIKENKMPGLNGTGPMGQGSQTGRGLGNCKPSSNSNEQQNIQRPLGGAFRRGGGRGFGGGFGGRGFGFRRIWNAAPFNTNTSKKENE